MANCYITAEPCTIDVFIEASEEEGFVIEYDEARKCYSLTHRDGYGCHSCSEEEHDEGTYVGSMGNPMLGQIDMVVFGSDEYRAICPEEFEDEDEGDEDEDD